MYNNLGPMAHAKLPLAIWDRALLVLVFCGQVAAWDYSSNGASWDALGQCGAGGPQSPINLPAVAEVEEEEKIFLKYPKLGSSFQLYNNGNSIAFTLPESYKGGFGLGAKLDALGSKDASAYRLWQVNFHSPSEHTLKGEQMPLEMQLMHQRVTGGGPETAVVVVLFQSAANSYLDFLDKLTIDGVPQKAWDEKSIPEGIELADIVGGAPFYKYSGSLTTPPCERQVKYFVRQEPLPTAAAQLRRFSKVLTATCAPKGNFRVVKPLVGALNLMASVDVVKAPDVTVKPKASKIEAKAVVGDISTSPTAFHCPPQFIDEKWKNIGRIQVGDSPELIKAKETYNREKREQQVAEGSAGNALRSYKFQKNLYDSSPGLAEKINNKWNLIGAESVLAGAKKALGSYSGAAQKRETKAREAILAACKKKYFVKAEKKAKAAKIAGPPPPLAKPVYPEPHLALPRGLAASPFGSGDASESGSGVAKVAANLQQEDLPPSSTIEESKGTKEIKPKQAKPDPEILIRMDLPISQAKIADKAAFKTDLIKAFAESADIAPDRLLVKEMKGQAVAQVHASLALAQKTLRGR